MIAHSSMISLYSILNQTWIRHLTYSSDIIDIFGNSGNAVTVLFADNSLRVIRQLKVANEGELKEPWKEDTSFKLDKLPGKVVDFHQDREDYMFTSFTSKLPNGSFKVTMLYDNGKENCQIFDVTNQFDGTFTTKPNFVFLYSCNDVTEFIIQHGHTIELYTVEVKNVADMSDDQLIEEENMLHEEEDKESSGDDDDNAAKK